MFRFEKSMHIAVTSIFVIGIFFALLGFSNSEQSFKKSETETITTEYISTDMVGQALATATTTTEAPTTTTTIYTPPTTVYVAPKKTTTTTYVAPSPKVSQSSGSVWDELAQCESGGNWAYPPVSGGFSGGIMFHITTWQNMGGLDYAPDAYLASREEQIAIAEKVLAVQGWGAWPGCSRKLGLR